MSHLIFHSPEDFFRYAIQRARGILRFGASAAEMRTFVKLVQKVNYTSHVFNTEDLLRDKFSHHITDYDIIVIEDQLPEEEFLRISEKLLNEVIYPCYFRHKPVFYFADRSTAGYSEIIDSQLLHSHQKKVVQLLKAEQIYSLLNEMCMILDGPFDWKEIPYPEMHEELMKHLTEENISFRENLQLGEIWFDFLIETRSGDVGLMLHGCDSRSRHFEAHRTKYLAVEGMRVYHINQKEDVLAAVDTLGILTGRGENLFSVDENLDANQRKAATHLAGPIRVLAPAGAGKTKTLVNRILSLLNAGVPQGNLLALAFNKKAAVEMEDRLQSEGVGASRTLETGKVAVMTFHAFGYKILMDRPGWSFDLQQAAVQSNQNLQQAVARFHELRYERNSNPLEPFENMLIHVKMDLLEERDMQITIGEEQVDFSPILSQYLQQQQQKKFLAFDDMLYLSLRLLLDDADLRTQLQQRFEYVLVDEFQDLNMNQIMLIELLSMPQNNLFIVGDDDQMIYGWRGAQVSHILRFNEKYPESADTILSRNYRSVQKVVQHSRWLIDHNQERVPKDITPRPDAGRGYVQLLVGETLLDQAEKAVHWIQNHQYSTKSEWTDYAILYRYNSYQFIVAAILDNYEIPHSPVDESRLFQTGVGRDLISYLKVLRYPDEAEPVDWQRILKRPNKYLSNEVTNSIAGIADLEASLEGDIMPWQREKLRHFLLDFRWVQEKLTQPDTEIKDAVRMITTAFGLREFYQQRQSGDAEPDMATDLIILEVLENYVSNFENFDSFYTFCRSLTDPARKPIESVEDGVQLSTIHSTKGNEYQHVLYFNLSNSVDQDPDEIEQERRVAYVGATRAIQSLVVTIPETGHSVFAEELFLRPEFYNVQNRKLRRLLKRLRKQRRNEEKSLPGFYDNRTASQMDAFNTDARSSVKSANQQVNEYLEEIRIKIQEIEDELIYRQIFFPDDD